MRVRGRFEALDVAAAAGAGAALATTLVLVLAGCAGSPSTAGPATTAPSTSAATAAAVDPSPGQVPPSGVASTQSPTTQPTVLPTNASVTVFYIAQGDGGTAGPAVGCGDSAITVTSPTISFTDPVEGALRTLLANHDQQIGQSGLENTLWQSQLAVASVERSGNTVTANLTGTLSMGGECDIPRVEAQLQLTANTAAGSQVAITINGKTLSEALSLK